MAEKETAGHACVGLTCWKCGEPTELQAMRNDISKALLNSGELELKFSDSRKLARVATQAIREDVIGLMVKIEELREELYQARRGPITRVEIDPNVRVRGNQTRTGLDDVYGPIAVGQPVQVFESEADIVGDAWVTDIEEDMNLVYLRVMWSSLKPREA